MLKSLITPVDIDGDDSTATQPEPEPEPELAGSEAATGPGLAEVIAASGITVVRPHAARPTRPPSLCPPSFVLPSGSSSSSSSAGLGEAAWLRRADGVCRSTYSGTRRGS